jgi:putative FmdB family regulatory protein
MPVYEFKCRDCDHITSELRKMGDFSPAACENCLSKHTEKIFSLFAGGQANCQGCTASRGPG